MALADLERELMSRDGPSPDDSLPPGFRELLPTLQADPAKRVADRESRLGNVRRLLDQLDSADNLVVKLQKKRVIRAELNALRMLE
jgi:hypothetical protein